jgi:hypothetical protein
MAIDVFYVVELNLVHHLVCPRLPNGYTVGHAPRLGVPQLIGIKALPRTVLKPESSAKAFVQGGGHLLAVMRIILVEMIRQSDA